MSGPKGTDGAVDIRRITEADIPTLESLDEDTEWISKTWGGPIGLAAGGTAWAAYVDERIASIACPFFLGSRYEDIGVVTETPYRRRGLSTACASAVIRDVEERGHCAVWTTSPDNMASVRLAERLGFVKERELDLYVVGTEIPS